MPAEQFHLLFVCTANICRSPIAAELTRRKIRAAARHDARQVMVSSAGVRGHEGAGMDPRAVTALRVLGARPAPDFSARALTVPLAGADLVLTAQRAHRAAVVALHPRAHRSAFTIVEFARLVEHVAAARLPAGDVVRRARVLVQEAARLRGLIPPTAADDIADPYGEPLEAYLTCAKTIEAALDGPLRVIFEMTR
jgi:low molecular weight protein-tyrosine phosphatase